MPGSRPHEVLLAAYAYLRAIGIGSVAGLRTATAVAATFEAIDSKWTGLAIAMAVGELVADKLPFTPSRLSPLALGARMASGGWSGERLVHRFGGSGGAGAALGVGGALAGAWLGYTIRAAISKRIPDPFVALVEDGIAIWGARAVTAMPPR